MALESPTPTKGRDLGAKSKRKEKDAQDAHLYACWFFWENMISSKKPPFLLACISLLHQQINFPPRPLCETEILAGCPLGSNLQSPVVRLAGGCGWYLPSNAGYLAKGTEKQSLM
jgi:hypothetical protein